VYIVVRENMKLFIDFRLGVYYCQQLILLVFCLSLCHDRQTENCLCLCVLQITSFLFLDGIEPFFGRQFSMWHSTKGCSSIFDLLPWQ